MRICLIAAALFALPVLSACGSDEPAVTQAELSKSLQDKGLKDVSLADCAAQVFLDSGMSQDGLRVMVANGQAGEQAKELNEDDAAKVGAAQAKIAAECVKLGG